MASNTLSKKYELVGGAFDVLSAVISLLDLSTDIIILVGWYHQQRMTFFWMSLCILILSQISYVLLFYYNHGKWDSLWRAGLSVVCTLPFSPVLSFVFYLVSVRDATLRTWLDKCPWFYFSWNDFAGGQSGDDREQQYLLRKLYKNLGFLIEAMVEAFPQSLLQLIAIVYFNEPTFLSILSILVSMTSVCSKLFLLLMTSILISWSRKIFIWLCFVADFVGVFFVVCFAFYQPSNHELQAYFSTLQSIMLYQLFICTAPFAVIGSIGMHLFHSLRLILQTSHFNCWKRAFAVVGIVVLVTVLWAIGLFVAMLSLTIFSLLWLGLTFGTVGITNRIAYGEKEKLFYWQVVHWVRQESVGLRDKMLRVCVLNTCVLEQHAKCVALLKDVDEGGSDDNSNGRTIWSHTAHRANYFDETHWRYLKNERRANFTNVTYKDLRRNCDRTSFVYRDHVWSEKRKYSSFCYSFYYQVYANMFHKYREKSRTSAGAGEHCVNGIAVITLFALCFISGPIYLLSRFFNVFLPLFIVLYLAVAGNANLFVECDTFQLCMWCVYVGILCTWLALGYVVARDEYALFHILPSCGHLRASHVTEENEALVARIQDEYFQVTVYPVVEQLLIQRFGVDIALVVCEYFNQIELPFTGRSINLGNTAGQKLIRINPNSS